MYQYQLQCDVMTQGLRYDTARVEFVFLNESGDEVLVRSSDPLGGSTDWSTVVIGMVRPPADASAMAVRLMVQRSEDGFEDIRGAIGFDNIRIDQFPQLQVTSDRRHGIYPVGVPIDIHANILGLATTDSSVHFRILNDRGEEMDSSELPIVAEAQSSSSESHLVWRGRLLEPGFYRVMASIMRPESFRGQRSILSNETTLAVD